MEDQVKNSSLKADAFVLLNNIRISQFEFIIQKIMGLVCWITGSRSEGVHLIQSDTDFIMCAPDIEACVGLGQESQENKIKLKIMDNGLEPGYGMLQVQEKDLSKVVQISAAVNGNLKDLCHDMNGSFYLSTSKILQAWSIHAARVIPWTGGALRKEESNGPAKLVTVAMGNINQDFDALYVISCTSLPQSITNFFQRRRNWPSQQLITKLQSIPVFLVPVGHPKSGEKNRVVEWKYSFNLQERELMRNLSGVQIVCYYILKSLQSHIEESFGSVIKSYYIKTCFLWMLESKQEQDWAENMVIPNAKECLMKIHVCMKENTCPHFFIPEQNIFDGKKISTENTVVLEKYIVDICNGENNIWPIMLDQVSAFLEKPYMKKEAIVDSLSTCRHLLLSSVAVKNQRVALQELEEKRKLVMAIQPEENAYDSDWIQHMQLSIQSHIGTVLSISDNSQEKNKNHDAEKFLIYGHEFDICSGKLKAATVQYCNGNTNKALEVTRKVVERNGENTMYFTGFTHVKDKLFDDIENRQKDWNSLLRDNVCFDMIFLPSEIAMCPPAIQLQLSEGRAITVNPLVYAYYLQFCISRSESAPDPDIENLLTEFSRILEQKEKAGFSYIDWELLSFCYLQTQEHDKAFKYLIEGKKKRDIGSAIYWQLALLLFDFFKANPTTS